MTISMILRMNIDGAAERIEPLEAIYVECRYRKEISKININHVDNKK